jgi:hypothetical protein
MRVGKQAQFMAHNHQGTMVGMGIRRNVLADFLDAD